MDKKWNFEKILVGTITISFVAVLIAAWMYALNLRQSVVDSSTAMSVNSDAVVDIERMRNTAESLFSNARSFFLLGTKTFLDLEKQDKENLLAALSNFEKKYNIPAAAESFKAINVAIEKHQEIFGQAMEFREKQTESKIVGQFYSSKVSPLRKQINEALDSVNHGYRVLNSQAIGNSKNSVHRFEAQVPIGMTWLSVAMTVIFLSLLLLVIKMGRRLRQHVTERDRLFVEAQKAVQDREEIVSAIKHDLVEPLATITQTAQKIAKTTDAGQLSANTDLIKSSVSLAEASIRDICDQKSAEAKGLTLRMNQLSIDEILDDVRLIMTPVAKQQDVRLQFDSVNPPILAFFDRERVIRILWNLIGNAIKFSPKHEKVVVKVNSDQKYIYISVTDKGPGISEYNQKEIFSKFWQSQKTAEKGPGIGLAIVKTIVEAHGGTLTVESQSGHGSTFCFSLPRRRPVGANLSRPTTTVKQKQFDATT